MRGRRCDLQLRERIRTAGRPTLTSMSTSRMPAVAAASIVASLSTATVTRASRSAAIALSRAGIDALVREEEVFAEARLRHSDDLEWRGARERPMPDCELLRRERGALVRLHVGAAAAAGQRRGHRREVVVQIGRFDDQCGGRKLGEAHALTLIRGCGSGTGGGSRDQRLVGRAEGLRDHEVEDAPRDLDAREPDHRRTRHRPHPTATRRGRARGSSVMVTSAKSAAKIRPRNASGVTICKP